MKNILIAALLLTVSSGMCIAGVSTSSGYSFNGDGTPTYPNEGVIWGSTSVSYEEGGVGDNSFGVYTEEYDTVGHSVNYTFSSRAQACSVNDPYFVAATNKAWFTPGSSTTLSAVTPAYDSCTSDSDKRLIQSSADLKLSASVNGVGHFSKPGMSGSAYNRVTISYNSLYNITGTTECLTHVNLTDSNGFIEQDDLSDDYYDFENLIDGNTYTLIFSNGAYYDFTCDGDEVFDYDACIWVYGYTCGVDNIKLYKDDSGWGLDDSASQDLGYDVYEMPIVDGEDYKISFVDNTVDGEIVVHNQTFSCTGDHVLIDFDRCNWIYPPNGPPVPIYIWTGYDYNIVVFKDAHGNLIENSQLAIYDKTDNQYIQRWTDAAEGYTLLGARFDTAHDVLLSIRTFDGIFTLDTTYPANGSALVGEEDIATTNWTIPIKYNLNVLPVDQYGVALFNVFCGLAEYTPLNPQAFWGMDLSDQGYVAVTNCSGFAMCDIIAEKEGYVDYKVEALNWTSKSALVKDYRHNVVMEEE